MSTEAKFSFTTRLGSDLFTVRGDTVEEFIANLDGSVHAVGNAQNLQAVSTAIGGLGGGTVVSQQPAPAAAPAPTPAPAAAPAGVPVPMCSHGQRVYKTGSGKKGQWQAYFCAASKDAPDKCDPVWVD